MSKQQGSLYTVIMDWDGGTFASQIKADDLDGAKKRWLQCLDFNMLEMDDLSKEEFISNVRFSDFALLDGLINIWCITPVVRDEIATVHFVLTSN